MSDDTPNHRSARIAPWVDHALAPFAPVRSGEGVVALLLFGCVFSILCAYYVLKTAREGLILTGGMFGLRGEELKIYATGAMALAFVGIVPAYSLLASRVRRIRLVNVSYAVVLVSLLVFFTLGQAGAPIGLAFYIWLGLANMLLVAQFWSYANDLYSEEQGRRLFAIIAVGGATGAIVGPRLAALAETYSLLVLAMGLFAITVLLFNVIESVSAAVRRSPATTQAGSAHSDDRADQPIGGREGGFTLVLRDPYLLAIAAMAVLSNLVNSTGEYILSSVATQHAAELVPATAHAELAGAARDAAIAADRREIIKLFYADLFFWVNLIGFAVQAFLVSRFMTRFGVRAALFVLPLVALGTYGAIASVGGLALVRVAKIAENASDYSIQNTVRQALFLPTARAVKYKAKTAIDTFFVRFGDALAAIFIAVAIHQLGLDVRAMALVNVAMVVAWLGLAITIARRYHDTSAASAGAAAPVPAASAALPAAPGPRFRPARVVSIAAAVVVTVALVRTARADQPSAADVAEAPVAGNESGLVEPVDPGDSVGRKVVRGLLTPPRLLIDGVFLPVQVGILVVDRYQLVDRAKRVFFNDAMTVGVFPIAQRQAGFGLTVGGRFVHRDLFDGAARLAASASAGGRYQQAHRITLRSGPRLAERLMFEVEGEYERRPGEAFFAVGNVVDAPRARYRHEIARTTGVVDTRVVADLHVRASASLADHELGGTGAMDSLEVVYPLGPRPEHFGARELYGELELRWDSRRAGSAWEPPALASTGTLAAVFVGRAHQLEQGLDYLRFGVDLQHYLRLAAGPRALVFRAHVEGVSRSALPFYLLPRLGGSFYLRGYQGDRFRDQLAAVGSVDYQWDLSRNFTGRLFVDAGRVGSSSDDSLALDELRIGYGLGIDLHTERSFVARASVSSSRDGGVFVDFALDPVFELDRRIQR